MLARHRGETLAQLVAPLDQTIDRAQTEAYVFRKGTSISQSKCHSSKTNSAEIAEGRSFQIVLNIVPSPILRPRLQFAFL